MSGSKGGVSTGTIAGVIFNLSNADTVVGYSANVGTYLRPTEILSPRLLRLGISVDF